MSLLDTRRFLRLLSLALLASCIGARAAEPVALRLIGINDFHGNLEPAGLSLNLSDPGGGPALKVPVGGAAALAGMVEALRQSSPHSLMISGGDLIGASPLVSSLFRHETTIEVMNAIGLDVSTVGNHEFDAGATELQRIAHGGCGANLPGAVATSCTFAPYRGAHFPYLAANVLDARGHPLFAPWVIRRVGGIPVGIIGAVTRTTPSIVVPSGVAGLRFTDEADAVNRAARQLRARGVKAIVMTIHEGGELGSPQQRGDWNDPTCPDAHGPIFEIAKRVTHDVGVIFSAHTHQGYRCMVDGRVIIQGTSYGRGVSVVDVMLDPKTHRLLPALTRSINLPVLNEQTDPAVRERLAAALPAPYAELLRSERPDPQIASLVARAVSVVAPKAAQPVGTIDASFTRGGEVDSAAGRLVADAQLFATRGGDAGGAQIALMNAGGIRSDLDCRGEPPCTVSFGQIFTMQPFGNSLVVMSLSGAQLKALLESQMKPGSSEMKVLQPSEGFTYAWTTNAPAGERVSDMRLDGRPIEPGANYRVTVNSFLAEGGDGFTLLTRGTDRTGGGQDLDAMMAYMKSVPRLAPIAEPRIHRMP